MSKGPPANPVENEAPMPESPALGAAKDEMDKLGSVIMTARKLVASGSFVDLTAMGDRIALFCEMTQTLPKNEQRAVIKDMLVLVKKLQTLEDELKDHIEQTRAQMGG